MGVSFKVSKTGTRFRPKPLLLQTENQDEENDIAAVEESRESQRRLGNIESGSTSARKATVTSFLELYTCYCVSIWLLLNLYSVDFMMRVDSVV